MAVNRADVVLAEAHMLIRNRAAWPNAPLIGSGTNWLRAGAVASLAENLADTDESMAVIRRSVRPMGLLDAVEVIGQHADYIAAAAEALRRNGAADAAMELEAEAADPDKAEWHKVRGQFLAFAKDRFMAERPRLPEWIGPPRQAPAVVAEYGEPRKDELDSFGVMRLSERLDELAAGKATADARFALVQRFRYPPADLFIEQAAAAKFGELWTATKQAFDRKPVPRQWAAATIPRRVMDRIAMSNADLAREMMQRVPPPEVVDTAPPARSALERLLK
ncbi:MAG: hypothetical protein OXH14_17050 [Alphaproteobacteria bacterium]|nr:hypothetical protein [Alphaproteobacteria bacterium]